MLKVRVDHADLACWAAAAGGNGRLSSWARTSLDLVATTPTAPAEVARLLLAARRDLNGLGSNVNRMAKALHAAGTLPVGADFARLTEELARLRRTLEGLRRSTVPPRRPA